MQIVIDNILTNYEIFGLKNKEVILILHGWGQSLNDWINVAERLAIKNKVILIDLPGFGSSSIPKKIFNTKDYSEFVSKFVNETKLTNFILIGHSYGGRIAIKYSKNNKSIKQLFLISPSGINSRSASTNLKILIVKILNLFTFWLPNKLRGKLSTVFASQDYISAGEMKSVFKKIVNESVISDVQKIKTSTIILWGENDKEINVKNSKKLKYLISNSTLRILWGIGHSPNVEDPEKLANLLLEYL